MIQDDNLCNVVIEGKAGGIHWRVYGDCFYIPGKELPRVLHAGRRVYHLYCWSSVRPRHETRPTRAEEQIKPMGKTTMAMT